MSRPSPAQKNRNAVTRGERQKSYELLKLYKAARAMTRYIAIGDRSGWRSCADVAAARLAVRDSLSDVNGWIDEFFSPKERKSDE